MHRGEWLWFRLAPGRPVCDAIALAASDQRMNRGSRHHRARKLHEATRQALAEFLLVPIGIIVGFLLLAACTFVLDRSSAAWLMPIRTLLQAYVFADARATGELLGTIAAELITIASITISLLLIALQQSASALTHQVYDQFLRNWQKWVSTSRK